jgi:hypothetical protein
VSVTEEQLVEQEPAPEGELPEAQALLPIAR